MALRWGTFAADGRLAAVFTSVFACGTRTFRLVLWFFCMGCWGFTRTGCYTVPRKRLAFRAAPYDFLADVSAFLEQDDVGVADGGEPMRDDEAGSAAHEGFHGFTDLDLGSGIDPGGHFVESDRRGIAQKHTGDGDQLSLSDRRASRFVIVLEGPDAVGIFGLLDTRRGQIRDRQ